MISFFVFFFSLGKRNKKKDVAPSERALREIRFPFGGEGSTWNGVPLRFPSNGDGQYTQTQKTWKLLLFVFSSKCGRGRLFRLPTDPPSAHELREDKPSSRHVSDPECSIAILYAQGILSNWMIWWKSLDRPHPLSPSIFRKRMIKCAIPNTKTVIGKEEEEKNWSPNNRENVAVVIRYSYYKAYGRRRGDCPFSPIERRKRFLLYG